MQCYLLCLQRCPSIPENHHDGSLFLEKQSQISFRVTAGISRNSHSRRFGWQRRLSFYRISGGFSETGSRGNWIIYWPVDIFVEWCFAISLLLTWPCIMWFRSWEMSLKDFHHVQIKFNKKFFLDQFIFRPKAFTR